MNKEQQELLDKAYENYHNYFLGYDDIPNKELFILACKTDTKLAERWGLKIEEKELSREERIDLYTKEYIAGVRNKYEPPFDDFIDAKLKTRNIPTRLITITYNNETLESYE